MIQENDKTETKGKISLSFVAVCIAAAMFLIYVFYLDLFSVADREVNIPNKGWGENVSLPPYYTWEGTFIISDIEAQAIEIYTENGSDPNLYIEIVSYPEGKEFFNGFITPEDITHDSLNNKIVRVFADKKLCNKDYYPRGSYSIRITNASSEDDFVFETRSRESQNGKIGSLSFGQYTKSNLGIIVGMVTLALCAVLLFAVYYLSQRKTGIEKIFFVAVILMGLIYLIMESPIHMMDSRAHIHASYRWSNILMGRTDGEWKGRADDVRALDPLDYQRKTRLEDLLRFSGHDLTVSDESPLEFKNSEEKMEFYSFVNYIPQTVAVFLGRLLGLSTWLTIQLGRFFVFTVYILGSYYAVKTIPYGKTVLSVFLLSPVAMMSAVSYSYDVFVILSSSNFIACVLKLFDEKENMQRKDLILCAVWTFLLGAIKGGGYLLFIPIIFMLFDKKKFISKCNFSLLGCILSGAVSVIIFDVLLNIGNRLFQFGGNKEGFLTTAFAFEHPVKYLKIWIVSFIDNFQTWILGAFRNPYYDPDRLYLACLMATSAVVIAAFSGKTNAFPGKKRLIMAIPVAIGFYFIPAMILLEVAENSRFMSMQQGRYFLPVEVLLCLMFVKRDGDDTETSRKLFMAFAVLSVVFVYFCIRDQLILDPV